MKRLFDYIPRICWKLYDCLFSFGAKILFQKKITQSYRYDNEIYYYDMKTYKKSVIENKNKLGEYWKKQKKFDLKAIFPIRYIRQMELIFEGFLPLFSSKPLLADIGCATGDWSVKVAPYASEVHGYEYSDEMVVFGKEKWGGYSQEYSAISSGCA